jgi:hypothetical protein
MKNLIIILLLGVFHNSANAQLDKGTWTIGSSVATSRLAFGAGYRDIRIVVSPSAQYFVSNKIAIGAGLDLDYSSTKADSSLNINRISWGFGPMMRYYITNSAKGGAFGQLKFFFGGDGDGNSTLSPELNIGYDFIISKSLALEIYTGYGAAVALKGGSIQSKIPFGIGFQIFLGK